ncbi:MAG: hypothetical protein ABF274_06165 [Nonlabens sp.]|uniref:hypothetical protein n=1 Tax=Nonlabens sp. TaxID=1888209 RepID=UPI00321A1489
MAPLAILIWCSKKDWIDGTLLTVGLLFYAIVYRTFTDGKRLAVKNIIPESSIWKLVVPGTRFQYFKELYLK